LGREVARARRIEDQADRVGARLRGVACVLGPRDAADLHARPHRGSPHFASYSIDSRYSPSGANVGAALFLSLDSSTSPTHEGRCLPAPTYTRLPTMLR